MKLPSKCPYCQDPMLTEYKGEFIVVKSCTKHIDHVIKMSADKDDSEVGKLQIFVPHKPPLWISWRWYADSSPQVFVSSYSGFAAMPWDATVLPFFEPDLSKYPQLCEKIKLYLLLS